MSGSKNNHYFIGGKLYVIPKEVADIVDETESRLTKERDILRAENERLLSKNESLKNGLNKLYDRCLLADVQGELSELINGELLDEISTLLGYTPENVEKENVENKAAILQQLNAIDKVTE